MLALRQPVIVRTVVSVTFAIASGPAPGRAARLLTSDSDTAALHALDP